METTFAKPKRKIFLSIRKLFTSIKFTLNAQLVLISIIFIALFVSTALTKLMDVHSFQGAMMKSPPIKPFAKILSYAVPIGELIIVLLLAVPSLNEINREKTMKPKTKLWARLWASFMAMLIFIYNAISKLSKRSATIGMWASFVTMFVFTAYVVYILEKFKGNLPCTCGGIISNLTWTQHLALNFSLLLIATWGIFVIRKMNKLKKIL